MRWLVECHKHAKNHKSINIRSKVNFLERSRLLVPMSLDWGSCKQSGA